MDGLSERTGACHASNVRRQDNDVFELLRVMYCANCTIAVKLSRECQRSPGLSSMEINCNNASGLHQPLFTRFATSFALMGSRERTCRSGRA